MLLLRDYVAHMASEVIKRLVEGGHIETKVPEVVANRILVERQDEMRNTGVSYQEMYKNVKQNLALDRKLVLR